MAIARMFLILGLASRRRSAHCTVTSRVRTPEQETGLAACWLLADADNVMEDKRAEASSKIQDAPGLMGRNQRLVPSLFIFYLVLSVVFFSRLSSVKLKLNI